MARFGSARVRTVWLATGVVAASCVAGCRLPPTERDLQPQLLEAAAPVSQDAPQVEALVGETRKIHEFATAAKNSLLERARTPKTFPKGVALTIHVYPLWNGEGDPPLDLRLQFSDGFVGDNSGELNSIWLVEGADGFRKEFTTAEVSFKRPAALAWTTSEEMFETLRGLVPLHSETFAITPDSGIETIFVKVYDRDRLGEGQKAAEVQAFLGQLGKASEFYGPANSDDIPIVSDLLRLLCFDLPNLFIANESLGQFKLVIQQQEGGVVLHDGWFVSGYTAFEVVANSF